VGYDIVWWFASNGYYYYQYQAMSSTHRNAIDTAVDDGAAGIFVEAGSIPTGLWIYDSTGNTWFHNNFGVEFEYPGYFWIFENDNPMEPIDGEYLDSMGSTDRNLPAPYGYYQFALDASWGATVTAECLSDLSYWGGYHDACSIYYDNSDWDALPGYSSLTLEDFDNASDREEFMMLFAEECGFDRP
jgi:hypothetical protein